jgi:hypothetical protein
VPSFRITIRRTSSFRRQTETASRGWRRRSGMIPELSGWLGFDGRGSLSGVMSSSNSYRGFRFPADIIEHAVWLYHCFSLSLRDVELILAARGIVVSYESIRDWGLRFGRMWDRPEIRGIMTIEIGSVRYVPGWGLADGMDVVFGWDGDRWSVPECRGDGDQPA